MPTLEEYLKANGMMDKVILDNKIAISSFKNQLGINTIPISEDINNSQNSEVSNIKKNKTLFKSNSFEQEKLQNNVQAASPQQSNLNSVNTNPQIKRLSISNKTKNNSQVFFNFSEELQENEQNEEAEDFDLQIAKNEGLDNQSLKIKQLSQKLAQYKHFFQKNIELTKDQIIIYEDQIQQDLNTIYKHYKQRIADAKQIILVQQLSNINFKNEIIFDKQILKCLFDINEFQITKIQDNYIEKLSSSNLKWESLQLNSNEFCQQYINELIENEFFLEKNKEKLNYLFDEIPQSYAYLIKKKVLDSIYVLSFHVEDNSQIFTTILQFEKLFTVTISRMCSLIINLISQELTYKQQYIQAKFILLEEYIRNIDHLLLESVKRKFENYFGVKARLHLDGLETSTRIVSKGIQNLQKVSIPEANVQIVYQMDFFSDQNQFTKIKIFEKIFTQIYYKFEKSITFILDRITQYRHFLRQQKNVFMHFNEDGILEYISGDFSEKMKKKYGIHLYCDEPFHFRDIFQNCSQLLETLYTVSELPDNHYSFISENDQYQPTYQIISQITKHKEFKGLYLIIQEESPEQLQVINLLKKRPSQCLNSSEDKQVLQAMNNLSNQSQEIKSSNLSKEMLMQDPQLMDSWLIEYLPLKDIEKIDKKLISTQLSEKQLEDKSHFKNYVQHNVEKKTSVHAKQGKINTSKSIPKFSIFDQTAGIIVDLLQLKLDNQDFLSSFDFPIFEKTEQELMRMSWQFFLHENLVEKFNLPVREYCNFISVMQQNYSRRKNPFHNFYHALTVMQGCFMISCKTKVKKYLNDIQIFSLILGGLCHDVKHTARTNQFEINSQSKIAMRYHDKSVLEQYHLAKTFKIIHSEENNILKNVDKLTYLDIRKYLINNILSTDVKEHFSNLKKFEVEFKDINITQFNDQNILLLCGIITHTADFYGVAQKFDLSKEWSLKVNQEFREQYKEEGELGIPQTPYLKDLDRMDILAKSEIGFIKFIVRPLWVNLNQFLQDDLKQCTDNLDDNIKQWEKIQESNLSKDVKLQSAQETQMLQVKTQLSPKDQQNSPVDSQQNLTQKKKMDIKLIVNKE